MDYSKYGDVQLAAGDLTGALASFREELRPSQIVADQNPSDTQWQRELSVSFNRVGEAQLAQGDLDGARTSFAEALRIREKLTEQDRSNAGWQ